MIRLTSPKLNYFIIIGSVLMYLSVFFEIVSTTQKTVFHSQCIVSPDVMISLEGGITLNYILFITDSYVALQYWISSRLWNNTGQNVEDILHFSQPNT